MQICRRRIAPGQIDPELIGLSISLASLAVAAIWFWAGLPWPQCLFHALTGHPCLTCGATRAAIQFFHGHFLAALRWNPLVFAGLCGLSIFDFYAAIVLTLQSPRLRIANFSSVEKSLSRVAAVIFLLLNWIYLLSRPPGIF